jgi:hypothetical protein
MIPWSHRSINGFGECLVKAELTSGVKVERSTNGHQPTMGRRVLQGRAGGPTAKQKHFKDLIAARGRKGGNAASRLALGMPIPRPPLLAMLRGASEVGLIWNPGRHFANLVLLNSLSLLNHLSHVYD